MAASMVSLETLKNLKSELSLFSDSHDFSPLEERDEEPAFLRPRRSSQLRGRVLWLTWIFSVACVGFGAFWLGQNNSEAINEVFAPSSVFDGLGQIPFDPKEFNLSETNTLFPEPLGKKILVLDVDSRPWDPAVSLKDQKPLGYGRMNHYLYGKTTHAAPCSAVAVQD